MIMVIFQVYSNRQPVFIISQEKDTTENFWYFHMQILLDISHNIDHEMPNDNQINSLSLKAMKGSWSNKQSEKQNPKWFYQVESSRRSQGYPTIYFFPNI